MKVLYNPVHTFIENKYKVRSGIFKVITVGRLIPVKNQMLIAEAVSIMPEKNDINLEIVGEGLLRPVLEKYKNKINLTLDGNSNKVNSHLLNADCFVLSSNSEGFPNALLEAMALGLPVIATNCFSGPLELLNNGIEIHIPKGKFVEADFGLLINVNDVEGLQCAITFLKNNTEKRKAYSEKSFGRSQDFSLTKIYAELINKIFNL